MHIIWVDLSYKFSGSADGHLNHSNDTFGLTFRLQLFPMLECVGATVVSQGVVACSVLSVLGYDVCTWICTWVTCLVRLNTVSSQRQFLSHPVSSLFVVFYSLHVKSRHSIVMMEVCPPGTRDPDPWFRQEYQFSLHYRHLISIRTTSVVFIYVLIRHQ